MIVWTLRFRIRYFLGCMRRCMRPTRPTHRLCCFVSCSRIWTIAGLQCFWRPLFLNVGRHSFRRGLPDTGDRHWPYSSPKVRTVRALPIIISSIFKHRTWIRTVYAISAQRSCAFFMYSEYLVWKKNMFTVCHLAIEYFPLCPTPSHPACSSPFPTARSPSTSCLSILLSHIQRLVAYPPYPLPSSPFLTPSPTARPPSTSCLSTLFSPIQPLPSSPPYSLPSSALLLLLHRSIPHIPPRTGRPCSDAPSTYHHVLFPPSA